MSICVDCFHSYVCQRGEGYAEKCACFVNKRSVVELPCSLGDKVFHVKGETVIEAYVDGIRFGVKRCCNNAEKYITMRDKFTNYSEKVSFEKFIRDVFTTRGAAERESERRKNAIK